MSGKPLQALKAKLLADAGVRRAYAEPAPEYDIARAAKERPLCTNEPKRTTKSCTNEPEDPFPSKPMRLKTTLYQ